MQCSELFDEIFGSGGGGCYRECVCGRIHFDTSPGWDWDEGELEELAAKTKKDPDKYIPHDETIGTMNINDVEIVWGCQCDTAQRYEQFLIHDCQRIAEYLNKYSAALQSKSEKVAVDIRTLHPSVRELLAP